MTAEGVPFISVIVPCFNGREHVRECLRSVLAQTEPQLEVVAVDDCSVDDSHAILQDFAASDRRVRVFRTPRNRGVSAARNLGLEQARGDFVFFLDSDDFIAPDALRALLEVAWADQVDLVRGLHLWLHAADMKMTPNVMEEMNQVEAHRVRFSDFPNAVFFYGSWATLFRRSLIEAHSLRFDESIQLGEDRLFNLAFLVRASLLTVLKMHCYVWRLRGKDRQASRTLIHDPASVLSSNERLVSLSEVSLGRLPRHRRWLHAAVFFDLVTYIVLPMQSWRSFSAELKYRLLILLERLDLDEAVLAEPFIKGRRPDLEATYCGFYRLFFREHQIEEAVRVAKKRARP